MNGDSVQLQPEILKETTKNNRYSQKNEEDDDSDEPDVPSEGASNDLEKDNDDNELSSLSQYQSVPRSMKMIKSNEKYLVDSWDNTKEKFQDYNSDYNLEVDIYQTKSPEDKLMSPLLTLENLNPEIDVHDFQVEAMSEF